jgi:limonene-1,2-epoxide hydrolase
MRIRFSRCLISLVVLFGLQGSYAWADGAADAKVVNAFLTAWQSHDVEKILSMVSDDCYYKNVPALSPGDGSMTGRAKMREFLAPFFRGDTLIVPFKFHTDVKFTIAGDGAVAVERVDEFEIANATFDLPVAGIFKVKNGKITYWVDYFDGKTFEPVTTLMKSLAKK